MELYLDSADPVEAQEAFDLGVVNGITTTPSFMKDAPDPDALALKLASMSRRLHVAALGDTAEEIVQEVHRKAALGLYFDKTVFKIPVSLHGIKACKVLVSEGIMVNMHLIYTLQQAYMAMQAGASYICPLVGRLQDQGHDALGLVEACVNLTKTYGYKTKVMFSSARTNEHVRNALLIGAHATTVPLKVIRSLTENSMTLLGIEQFKKDSRRAK